MYLHSQRLHGTALPRPLRPSEQCLRSRRVVVVASSYCPYQTLGVAQDADEKEIKTAYRKLALRYHPDISTAENAAAKFISIQEAYNILTGKQRGKELGPNTSPSQGSWDFHDWYWQFRMSRSWERQKGGTPKATSFASGHQHPESKEGIRTQLAGLRHRAAIRKVQERNAASATEAATEDCAEVADVDDSAFHTEAADVSDGANYTAAGNTSAPHSKPKFVATKGHKAKVVGQLSGLRRKGHLKQQGAF